ncbi:MAG: Nucleotidyl transferase [Frankiales bacterium]|nr:Nucleotidyl transferase [Frankiales bacterium]
MDAIVLVGGQGSRLRPLTETTPKPMLPVAGVPFLTHLLLRARDAGIDHVVLSTSYKSEVFRDHFGDGSALGIDLEYVQETDPLGTGGGIRNVVSSLRAAPGDPVVVFNGDVLSGHDIAGQVDAHVTSGAAVTLYLTEVEDPRRFGIVPTDAGGRVTAFLEKSETPVTNRINAGCYVFRRDVIDLIPAGRPVSVERETFPALLAGEALVRAWVESAYWLDLGTPESFLLGSCDLVRGVVTSPAVSGSGDDLVLDGASVASDAVLTGGTTVGAGATVGAGTSLDRCVLFDGVQVGERVALRDCIVGRGAVIGDDVVLTGVVVGDGARVGSGNELEAPARVWTGAVLADGAVRSTVG